MSRDAAVHQRAAMKVGEINVVADNVNSAFSQNREALLADLPCCLYPCGRCPAGNLCATAKIPFAGIMTTNYDDLLSQGNADTGLQRLTPRDFEHCWPCSPQATSAFC